MSDPNWSRGHYYSSIPPHIGMKLAREIATVTYRSGPEWEQRFGRLRADSTKPPALCPDFKIETYLDHAGEKWCLEYDANSLLYISKAMDLFDLSEGVQKDARVRRETYALRRGGDVDEGGQYHKVLVIGVASDILFPAWQQREIVDALKEGGNENITHVELGEDVSLFGHDTFLLDTVNVGGVVGEFLKE
ncbi:hypothetical protein TWF703_003429 [Orbilia oligospora]|uniref:AB hydrolase-1 domain-containing protein n=1 Tax=Orbilia oligospora TaxID=2813651 RepID=A0A7C8NXT1_ORBOL|nr:hypothetical protein TWF703_003429 [Orbilia oligospora]